MEQERQLKLLIVDDEAGIVDYISRLYARKGYSTFSATDGIAAVEIFKKERPEVSLIDVHMPYSPIDGVETLRRIRAIDAHAVCIMVSRIAEPGPVKAAKEAGAYAYLLKPVAEEDIDQVIAEAREKD